MQLEELFLEVIELFCTLIVMVICRCICQILRTVYRVIFTLCKLKNKTVECIVSKKVGKQTEPSLWSAICIPGLGLLCHYIKVAQAKNHVVILNSLFFFTTYSFTWLLIIESISKMFLESTCILYF